MSTTRRSFVSLATGATLAGQQRSPRRTPNFRVVPEHDHRLPHPGLGQGVQDVLEDRPATDRREQFAATEARSGPGGQDESHGSIGHIGIFPPPCGQSSLAAPRPTTPVAGRRCEGVRDR
jgi:hypothetical protein